MATCNIAHQSSNDYSGVVRIRGGSVFMIFVGSLAQNLHHRRKQNKRVIFITETRDINNNNIIYVSAETETRRIQEVSKKSTIH